MINDNLEIKDDDNEERTRILFSLKRQSFMSQEEERQLEKIQNMKNGWNFLTQGIDQFMKLIKLNNWCDMEKPQTNLYEFLKNLSYCLCKVVCYIVEDCIKKRHNGRLDIIKSPLEPEEIRQASGGLITRISHRVKQYVRNNVSVDVDSMSLKIFREEYFYMGYNNDLPNNKENLSDKKIGPSSNREKILLKGNKTSSELIKVTSEQRIDVLEKKELNTNKEEEQSKDIIFEAWRNLKPNQKVLWIKRVIAENQINRLLRKNKDLLQKDFEVTFINEYAKFLFNELRQRKHQITAEDICDQFSAIFKTWYMKEKMSGERIASLNPDGSISGGQIRIKTLQPGKKCGSIFDN
jgi:hypothetical protein